MSTPGRNSVLSFTFNVIGPTSTRRIAQEQNRRWIWVTYRKPLARTPGKMSISPVAAAVGGLDG